MSKVTLEQAIQHAKELAEKLAGTPCGAQHSQLAEWLSDLRDIKEAQKKPAYYVLVDDDDYEFNSHNEFSCGRTGGTPLYTVPPAPMLPKKKTSERLEWTVMEWITHVGGRYQHGNPGDYIEFGSVQAVHAMLTQIAYLHQTIGWNACITAIVGGSNEQS